METLERTFVKTFQTKPRYLQAIRYTGTTENLAAMRSFAGVSFYRSKGADYIVEMPGLPGILLEDGDYIVKEYDHIFKMSEGTIQALYDEVL